MSSVVPHSREHQVDEGLDQCPENAPLGVRLEIQKFIDVIRSLPNGKALGPGEFPVEFSRSPLVLILYFNKDCSGWASAFGNKGRRGGPVIVEICNNSRGIFMVVHAHKMLLKIAARRHSEYCMRVGILHKV